MQEEKRMMLLGFLGILLATIPLVSAFGAAVSYWDDNPLQLAPGESKVVTLSLQNMVGGEDVTLKANVTEGKEIATIVDNDFIYSVPFGEDDIPVNIKIEVPANAEIENVYKVTVSFQQISSDQGGMLQVAGGFTSEIPIKIVGVEDSALRLEEKSQITGKTISGIGLSTISLIIAAIILIVIIIFFVIKKKKEKQVKKEK